MEERGRGGLALWGNQREGRKPMEDEKKIAVEKGMKMHRQGLGHYRGGRWVVNSPNDRGGAMEPPSALPTAAAARI